MEKAERGDVFHESGHGMGTGRGSTQLIFRCPWLQTWVIGLSRQKDWGHGTKVCIVKQFSYCWGLDAEVLELSSGARQVLHPTEGLLLGVVSLSCPIDVMYLSWHTKWLKSDCKENGLQQRQTQNGGHTLCFSLAISYLSAQVRSQCFSVKATWAPLTMVI
jgi:hypothetical protein